MRMTSLFLIAGLACAACATQPDDVFSRDEKVFLNAAKHGGAEAELNGEKVVCKREAVTGSRVSRSVCLTKAEWDRREKVGEDLLENVTERSANLPDPRYENPAN